MLSRFRLAQLLWVLLLVCGLFVFGSDRAEAEEALASWYGPGFDGLTTASGETFDADGLSTAHQTLPMGTELIVSYEGKSVPVTVNDRGPFTGERELDLSQGAAEELGLIGPGVDYVEVTCANGGVYPNCTPGVAGPPSDIVVQEMLPAPPSDIAAQEGIPAPPTETFSEGVSTAEDGTTVQDGAGSGMHLVQPGETLQGIAGQLGTSVDHLSASNGITNPSLIYAGQSLVY